MLYNKIQKNYADYQIFYFLRGCTSHTSTMTLAQSNNPLFFNHKVLVKCGVKICLPHDQKEVLYVDKNDVR